MKRMGRKEGAPYANWVTWPNTTHCSRLLMLAEKHGLSDAVVGRLYRACYEEGQNVSLRETVARVATEAGVPDGAEYIMSDADRQLLCEVVTQLFDDAVANFGPPAIRKLIKGESMILGFRKEKDGRPGPGERTGRTLSLGGWQCERETEGGGGWVSGRGVRYFSGL